MVQTSMFLSTSSFVTNAANRNEIVRSRAWVSHVSTTTIQGKHSFGAAMMSACPCTGGLLLNRSSLTCIILQHLQHLQHRTVCIRMLESPEKGPWQSLVHTEYDVGLTRHAAPPSHLSSQGWKISEDFIAACQTNLRSLMGDLISHFSFESTGK